MAKKLSSQSFKPDPFAGYDEDMFRAHIKKQAQEIEFLRKEVYQAAKTISGLTVALNEKKTGVEYKERPPVKKILPKFYNPATKEYEPPTADELAQFQDDCSEILGFHPALTAESDTDGP